MHDCNGTELHEGDVVSIDFVVKALQPDNDYCNVQLDALHQPTVNGQTPMTESTTTCTKFVRLLRRTSE